MSGNIFIPKAQRNESVQQNTTVLPSETGNFERVTLQIAQYAVIALFVLLPVFFTTGLKATLGFDKAMLAVGLLTLVVILSSLISLRRAAVKTVAPLLILVYVGFLFVAGLSALLSGDVQDAFTGNTLEVHTLGFLALLGVTMLAPLVWQRAKNTSLYALVLFAASALLVLLYMTARIVFGADILSFGSFLSISATPVGSFNDLAIFSGLLIIMSLITILLLPLRFVWQGVLVIVTLLSLFILSVINFYDVWIVIGFLSLAILLYTQVQPFVFSDNPLKPSGMLLGLVLVTVVFSGVFIFMNQTATSFVTDKISIDYVEVRPSLAATIAITQDVYDDHLLLGVGPNRFADAWRSHKDLAVNQTIFWNTDFTSGFGYVPTLFSTTGLIGGILFVLFQLYYLWVGYRMLVHNTKNDTFWYYVGAITFASAVFLWGMSYLYVPSATLLLLAALLTGFSFVAYGALVPQVVRTIPLVESRKAGFIVMAVSILLIVSSVGALYSVSQQYTAQKIFVSATGESAAVDLARAYQLYPNDQFVSSRAELEIAKLRALLDVAQPTQEQQKDFIVSAQNALQLLQTAIDLDVSFPDHYALRASVYGLLAITGVDNALENAERSFAQAIALDPHNPEWHLLSAELAAGLGDNDKARSEILRAIELKGNYTNALLAMAQIDISEGNTENAIAATEAVVTLEPNNPTRYFQLGVLYAANDDQSAAIDSFLAAIELDPEYANARYMLALAYVAEQRIEEALTELRIVQNTNQTNEPLKTLISQLESGEEVVDPFASQLPVGEVVPEEVFENGVTTPIDPDSDLIVPINPVPSADNSSAVEPDITEVLSEELSESEITIEESVDQ